MVWKDNFKAGKELVLSSCSKSCVPHANVVLSLGFVDDNLLVANCQMNTTIANLKETKVVCAVGGYVRIKGKVKILSSGKYFELCVKKNKGYDVRQAILISVEEVFDLDKCQKLS
ncbi:MAG: pyridoxamine 5'-phosphate oxidase family protein [Candidatus Nanoarchaeia archaeon]